MIHRRTFLFTTGAAAMSVLAGCSGSEDSGSDDSGSDGDDSGGDEEQEQQDEQEQEQQDEQEQEEAQNQEQEEEDEEESGTDPEDAESGEDVEENAGLVIQEHEFVEDDYSGYVEGIVENTTDEQKDYVEVRVRAYDTDGNQLDSYLDNTQDLDGGATWAFSVPILDYEEMEDYDIAVSDNPL